MKFDNFALSVEFKSNWVAFLQPSQGGLSSICLIDLFALGSPESDAGMIRRSEFQRAGQETACWRGRIGSGKICHHVPTVNAKGQGLSHLGILDADLGIDVH